MARSKPYDYNQDHMVPVKLSDQIEPGTFDTLKKKRDKFRRKAESLMKEHKRRDRRLANAKNSVPKNYPALSSVRVAVSP